MGRFFGNSIMLVVMSFFVLSFQNCANPRFIGVEGFGAVEDENGGASVVLESPELDLVDTQTQDPMGNNTGAGAITSSTTNSNGSVAVKKYFNSCLSIHFALTEGDNVFWTPMREAFKNNGGRIDPNVIDYLSAAEILFNSNCSYDEVSSYFGPVFAQSISGYMSNWKATDIPSNEVVPNTSLYLWGKSLFNYSGYSGAFYQIELSPSVKEWMFDGPTDTTWKSYDKFVHNAAVAFDMNPAEKYFYKNPGAEPMSYQKMVLDNFTPDDVLNYFKNQVGLSISPSVNLGEYLSNSCEASDSLPDKELSPYGNTLSPDKAAGLTRKLITNLPNATVLLAGYNNGKVIPMQKRGVTDGRGFLSWEPCKNNSCTVGNNYVRYFIVLDRFGNAACTTARLNLNIR